MASTHLPILRLGKAYQSLDVADIKDPTNGEVLAQISLANPGLIRKDMKELAHKRVAFQGLDMADMLALCQRAASQFMNEALPLGVGRETQSPQQYVATLSRTSGLPETLCRENMKKIHYVLTHMRTVLTGLTRNLDLAVMDQGVIEQQGLTMSYYASTNALSVILPSNSPAVNSLWLPALAMKTPVVLKPGSEEPWTPWRLVQALMAAGCPAEVLGFYPTSHEGAATIMDSTQRAIIFGDLKTVDKYRHRPDVSVHGPGNSKILVGNDRIDDWPEFMDVLHDSIMLNSGRSCINVSTILVPKHGREIAQALAERMLTTQPLPLTDSNARLSAFANKAFAHQIDSAIEEGLETDGAEDLTAQLRETPRCLELEGNTYLQPTLIYCDNIQHPLASTEFMFPYVAVVEVAQPEMLTVIGTCLVVTAISRDETWIKQLLQSPKIERLNIGAIATPKVEWNQPHEGNLFEFLYRRRSIQVEKTEEY